MNLFKRKKYSKLTENVSVDRKGNIYFSHEEIESARIWVEEYEKQERERLEFLSKSKYSIETTHSKIGVITKYFNYTKEIPKSEFPTELL
jgi:hypothetical protein